MRPFTYERARSVPNSPGSFLQYLKHVTKTAAPDPLTVLVETDGPDPILLNELQNVWIVSRKNGAGEDEKAASKHRFTMSSLRGLQQPDPEPVATRLQWQLRQPVQGQYERGGHFHG